MQVQTVNANTQNAAVALAVSSEVAATATGQIERAPSVERLAKKTSRQVKQLNRVNLRTFIVSQHGKFVSVDYRKICGEERTLVGRLGVTKYLKGGDNKVERIDRPYLTMFDIKLGQYRTVSLDSVREIRALGHNWKIID